MDHSVCYIVYTLTVILLFFNIILSKFTKMFEKLLQLYDCNLVPSVFNMKGIPLKEHFLGS